MADEHDTPEQGPSGADAAREAMDSVSANLTTGEQLLAGGALLILVVSYLLGEVIVDGWGVDWAFILILVGALGLIYTVKMRGGSVPIPYAFTLRVSASAAAVYAVTEILWFIDGGNVDGFGVVAALAEFAGILMMVLGGRQITD